MNAKARFPGENVPFYLAGMILLAGFKLYYRQADCDSLLWILTPTVRWVELLSGISFVWSPGAGYVNPSRRILIAPSCSGLRFMMITLAMLIFSFVPHAAGETSSSRRPAGRLFRGMAWIFASVFLSFSFTVLVNGIRILAAIRLPSYFEDAGLLRGALTPDRLHTAIGVVVYFTALLLLHRLMTGLSGQKDGRGSRGWASPVFWYCFMALGLPFLNRMLQNNMEGFGEYARLILRCLALVLFPWSLFSLLRKRVSHSRCR